MGVNLSESHRREPLVLKNRNLKTGYYDNAWTEPRLGKRFGSVYRELAENGSMATRELYSRMEALHPDLCDPSVPCDCSGGNPNQPESKHQMRWAQQDLKNQGKIEYSDNEWQGYISRFEERLET